MLAADGEFHHRITERQTVRQSVSQNPGGMPIMSPVLDFTASEIATKSGDESVGGAADVLRAQRGSPTRVQEVQNQGSSTWTREMGAMRRDESRGYRPLGFLRYKTRIR